MHIFICEDSLDGILTGVYLAWSFKLEQSKNGVSCTHDEIHLVSKEPDNLELFSEYHTVLISPEQAAKVRNTLLQKLGQEFLDTMIQTSLSKGPCGEKEIDKADAIYHTIVLALNSNAKAGVLNHLANPYVQRVFLLSRAAASEAHHLKGFLRFSELENGVLFSTIHPKHHALPILAEHFTDRFPNEDFLIYDENRKLAAVHRAHKNYMLVDASDLNQDIIGKYSEKEAEFRRLWLTFFESIAIEARKNPNLQAKNIPKRFWKDTVELASSCKAKSETT